MADSEFEGLPSQPKAKIKITRPSKLYFIKNIIICIYQYVKGIYSNCPNNNKNRSFPARLARKEKKPGIFLKSKIGNSAKPTYPLLDSYLPHTGLIPTPYWANTIPVLG